MTVVFQSGTRISVVEKWATLLIFGSVEGAISKSVAQFFALIFAYITPSLKSFNDILSSIF